MPEGKGQTKIPIAQIAYIFHEDDVVFLRTRLGINYPLGRSLEAIERILEVNNFEKVNRNYTISYTSYVSWKKYPTGRMLLTLDPPAISPLLLTEIGLLIPSNGYAKILYYKLKMEELG